MNEYQKNMYKNCINQLNEIKRYLKLTNQQDTATKIEKIAQEIQKITGIKNKKLKTPKTI